MAYRTSTPYISASQRRKARQDRAGLALIAATAMGFAGLFAGAYAADHARGISVEASLASAGIGRSASHWQIVHVDARGDLYVDDYNLSLLDCIKLASARNQSARGKFQCEREG